MPFDRPSLSDLVSRARVDLQTRLALAVAVSRRRVADAIANSWAGAIHSLYGALDWLARQLFAATADDEYLLRIASLYRISPIPATFAEGAVVFTGVNGSSVPAATLVVRDDGESYKTLAGGVIAGGVLILVVRALTAGAAANLASGETLTIDGVLPGVNSTVTVGTLGEGGPIDGGQDQEELEALRERLLERLRTPPAGGRDADYIAWAKLVTGVTRVWVYRHELGLGTVVVRFVRDSESPIIPDAGEIAAVAAAIEKFRPTTAEVTVLAPVAVPVLYTLSITPDTTALRTAVEDALDDLHTRDSAAGDGAGRGTIKLARIYGAIDDVTGLDNFTVSAPVADVVPATGELLTRGTVTWV